MSGHQSEPPENALPGSIIRRALRSQLDVLLSADAPLYNPLFCGPLGSGEALVSEVRTLAEVHGLPLLGPGDDGGGPGFLVMDADDAERLLASGRRPAVSQWIIWAPCDAAALPERVAAWLGRSGFPIRISASLTERWSIAAAVRDAVAAREEGAFVVVAAEPAGLARACAELCLHLELARVGPVARLALGELSRWLDAPRGTPVAGLRLRDLRGIDPSRLVASAAAAGGMAALVFDPEAFDWVSVDPAWQRVMERALVVERISERWGPPTGVLPRVEEIVVGGWSPRTEPAMSFSLAQVPLGQVLQTAEAWEGVAELLVFTTRRFGRVEISAGRIRSVSPDPHTTLEAGRATEAEMLAALLGISGWQDAGVLLLTRLSEPEPRTVGGVQVQNAVFAMTMGPEAGMAERSAGVPLRISEVADRLVERGLASAAIALLERGERESEWGAREEALLGSLLVGRDPEGAAIRLRHAAVRAVDGGGVGDLDVYVGATLNALLIEVRAGARVASSALGVVADWVERSGTTWVLSPQHAAIWMELALRAGAPGQAARAQEALRAVSNGTDVPWRGLLDLEIEGCPNQEAQR